MFERRRRLVRPAVTMPNVRTIAVTGEDTAAVIVRLAASGVALAVAVVLTLAS